MGSWYNKDGLLVEADVIKARKHGLYPRLSNVLYLLAKDKGLADWIKEQPLRAAMTLSRNIDVSDDEFVKLAMAESEEQSKKVMAWGDEVHNLIARYLERTGVILLKEYSEKTQNAVMAVLDWIDKNVVVVIEVEQSRVDTNHGYGGTYDLLAEMLDGSIALIDWKTQGKPQKELKSYKDWRRQLAAYNILIGRRATRFINVVISSVEPGEIKVFEHKEKKMIEAEKEFLSILNTFKVLNKLKEEV